MKKSKKIKENKPKITFKQAEGISEEEMQQNLDRAFDFLFNLVEKKRNSE